MVLELSREAEQIYVLCKPGFTLFIFSSCILYLLNRTILDYKKINSKYFFDRI